jgi:serine/threonine-protein kinase
MRMVFDESVRGAAVVTCPGSIQSPGRGGETPRRQRVSGMLVCGLRNGVPTIIWSTEADLRVSRVGGVSGDASGVDRLYRWRSTHS